MKIRTKLIICFMIPAIFTLILGMFSYRTASNIIIENYESSISQTINATAKYYAKMFDTIKFKANQLCADSTMKSYYSNSYSEDEVEEKFEAIEKSIKSMATQDIFSISMIPREMTEILTSGSYVEETEKTEGTESEEEENDTSNVLYEKFLESEEGKAYKDSTDYFMWTGTHNFLDDTIGIEKSKYGLCLVRKFTNINSYTIGYLFLDVRMGAISQVMSELEMPEGSYLSLVTSDGRELCYHTPYLELLGTNGVIVDSADSTTLDAVGITVDDMISSQSFYQEDVVSEETSGYRYVTYQGETQLFVYNKLEDTGVTICALIPKAAVTSQADSIKNSCILLLAIAIMVAIGIGFFVARSYSIAIKKVITGMDKVATGDLSIQLKTKRKDEFRKLTDSANHMIHNTKVLIEKVAGVSGTLNESSNAMKDNTSILLEATNNIVKAIEEIQAGILHQASEAEECRKLSDTLEERIEYVSNHVTNIQKVADESTQNVSSGIQTIDALSKIVNDTSNVTKVTIDNMSELHRESNNIGEILNVINDIAEQTNLLSLNASIEAARAGESGRGFMVVAEEIRKLAEMSLQSASKIGEMIQHIQDKTNQTADTVKNSESLMKQEETELKKVVEKFQQIDWSVNLMVKSLERISTGIHDMDESKNQTIQAIHGITQISEESAASTEEVNATANEQLNAVDYLNVAALHLAEQASEMQSEINKFQL